MKNLVKTKKEFKEFTPRLKDILCDVYKYIIRSQETKVYFEFTHNRVKMAHDNISCISASETWVNIFMANIDQIKELVENQPTYLVEITSHTPTHMGEFYMRDEIIDDCYISRHTQTFRKYDKEKAIGRLNLIKSTNFFQSYRVSLDGVEIINEAK